MLGFRAGWSLVRWLPARLAYGLFHVAADLAWRRGGPGVERMRSNYAKIRPELTEDALDGLVRAGMRSYLRYWCQAFRLPELSADDITAAVRVEGPGLLREEVAAGRPVVMFLGHLGNWDLAGAWSTTHLTPVTTVAERLEPEEVFTQFVAFRESLGMRIIPLSGGADVFRELRGVLARPHGFVPLLADRDLTHGGVEVDFCGHRARMAVGPAALAVTTGAALFPVSVHYERGRRSEAPATAGWQIVLIFHEQVPVPGEGATRDKVAVMTQQCADALATTVRAHPQDWHMMQRVFTDDLDPVRLDAAVRDGRP